MNKLLKTAAYCAVALIASTTVSCSDSELDNPMSKLQKSHDLALLTDVMNGSVDIAYRYTGGTRYEQDENGDWTKMENTAWDGGNPYPNFVIFRQGKVWSKFSFVAIPQPNTTYEERLLILFQNLSREYLRDINGIILGEETLEGTLDAPILGRYNSTGYLQINRITRKGMELLFTQPAYGNNFEVYNYEPIADDDDSVVFFTFESFKEEVDTFLPHLSSKFRPTEDFPTFAAFEEAMQNYLAGL